MSESSASMELMHDLLKDMRGSLAKLEQGQRLTNERLGAIEHHMAGFHVTVSSHNEEIDTIKERIERIERRLEITE